jgi:hypothetical protein
LFFYFPPLHQVKAKKKNHEKRSKEPIKKGTEDDIDASSSINEHKFIICS